MGEFTDALVLTTPHEKGQRVKDAQWLMQGHSVFGAGLACLKDGAVDGDFGPLSAQAAARTKWWLGYPQTSCDPTFGQALYDLLEGKTKLTPSMEAARIKRLADVTPGLNALTLARRELGNTEHPPGSNMTKYGQWYGFNGVPWCAIFESYCFSFSGYKHFHYAAVENIYYDALAARNNLRIIHSPTPGDLVCYSFQGERFAHTAFFDGWISQGSTFYDLAGNTGHTNLSNGGEVLRQQQSTSIVLAYVRVG